jgi:hypothetical protein
MYDDEQSRVAYLIRLWQQVRTRRLNFETQWEESAALCLPEYRNSFTYGHVRPPGVKYTQYQVDSSGAIALHRFMAVCEAMLTPHNMLWSIVRADNPDIMRDRKAKEYFVDVTKTLWAQRYRAAANFVGQQQQNYLCLGGFGNQYMFVDALDNAPARFTRGLRYVSLGPGELYLLQNHQGRVDGAIRHFRWTARQAMQRWQGKIPQVLKAAYEQNSPVLFDFLQFILPRADYDPLLALSPKGRPWSSIYVSVVGYAILEEGGYRSFPIAVGRYTQAPEEDYGRGPCQQVLPELKTLNAEKSVFLKQGHRAGDPAYLIADDGLMDFKNHPGSFNYGGMTADGKPLVGVVPTGDIQITKEMMDESAKAINDAFLVSLFPLLFDNKGNQKSAREVVETAVEQGIFLTPLGRQYGEYLGTLIERELDLLSYMGLLPEMPDVLKEAKGEYQIIYTSPLARSMEGSQPIAGFMRTLQMGQEVVNVTGDNSIMDIFDFDTALAEIGEEQFVPPRWFADEKEIAQKRKARAAAAARDQESKELPGKAAIMKAQAITAKAQTGGNIGGTLSGTPAGGMPEMPAASQGTPGMPGAPGQPGQPGMPASGP